MNKSKVTVFKNMLANVTATELFYKYKNIRIYRLMKESYLTYWYAVLILDESHDDEMLYRGKLIPAIDFRSLPNWDDNISGLDLIREPRKYIPKIYREAVKKNYITEDMYVDWDETKEEYLIDEI